MSAPGGSVAIVGAGPVGLITALRLARFGVPVTILEASPELLKRGSKACLIHGDALEILDKVGCADEINAEGVTWTVARTYVRNQVIRTARYPRPLGFGPFVNISQYRIEQVLAQAVARDSRCDLRWGHQVTGLAQDGDGVSVQVLGPDGPADLRFRYVVACDGVRSTIRELTGAEWTGYTHQDRFLITDIRARLPLAKERHFHYDPSFNPGRQLVMHPQPNDIWRIDWQLPPDADIEGEQADGTFDRRVRAVIGDVPYEIDWVSTYRFHQRVVRRLRDGRVFFAGDAAHSLPPYGSRGMNSGIQDADNLAWKLALVLHEQAAEELLETYHTERYAAASENLRVTEATIRFMVPPNWLRRQARNLLLRACRPLRLARGRVNSGHMTEPFTYTDSPIVQPGTDGALLGRFAPDGPVREPGHPDRLRRLFGSQFTGLYFAASAADADRFAAAARARPWAAAARLVVVLPGSATGEDQPGTNQPGDLTVLHDPDGSLRQAYGGASRQWWIVRPDSHLAACGSGDQADDFAAALLRSIGGHPDASAASPAGELPAAPVRLVSH